MMTYYNKKLYGAILGDIAGSLYEFKPLVKGSEADLKIHDERGYITDDSLLTIAVADAIIKNIPTVLSLKAWSNEYNVVNNKLGFGSSYKFWIESDEINNSWGNGALMRVSPFMWINGIYGAVNSTQGSHEHYKSILSIVKLYELYYSNRVYKEHKIEVFEKLDESCEGTIDFVQKMWENFPNLPTQKLILKTITYNGDCDTNASILGELSNFHNQDITKDDVDFVNSKLDEKQLLVVEKFNKL